MHSCTIHFQQKQHCTYDSNVLAMGERVIGPGLALEVVDTWLNTEFEGGRHEKRVCKIEE